MPPALAAFNMAIQSVRAEDVAGEFDYDVVSLDWRVFAIARQALQTTGAGREDFGLPGCRPASAEFVRRQVMSGIHARIFLPHDFSSST